MGVINVLDKHIAELIAAGEVVERPSSVIKELVENSIDAGAKNITVEIKNGGTTFMRVSDDGCGIQKDDIKVAFLRHATSKIKSENDLDGIATLGFRGEALASICAVSKLQLITRNVNEDIGSCYQINGGEEVSFEDAGCPVGTTFVIRDLFFNIPARAKFLKKDVSEGNAVSNVIDKTALSHPEISFTYIKDGKQVLKTFGDGKLMSAIYSVFGKDFAHGLIPVDYQLDAIKVYGYVSKPEFTRANRNMQNFFINGRYVVTKTGMGAISDAFKGSIMVGKFPSCVLNLELPHEIIDVNVHPAKIEVRFINERPVYDAIYHAVKSALTKFDSRKQVSFKEKSDFNNSNKFNPFHNAKALLKKSDEEKQSSFNFSPVTAQKATNINEVKVTDIKEEKLSNNKTSAEFTFNPFDDIPFESKKLEKEGIKDNKGFAIDFDNLSFCEPTNPLEIYSKKAISNSAKEKTFSDNPQTMLSDTTSIFDDEIKNIVNEESKNILNNDNSIIESKTHQISDVQIDKQNQSDTNFADLILEKDQPIIKYIGEVFSTYIIAEKNNKEILLIDKHAAHERMIYEKLKADKAAEFSQLLLQPITVTLNKDEYDAVINNLDVFSFCCFDVEDFGNGTVIVRSAPQYIDAPEIGDCITEMADHILKGKNDISTEKMDWFYHNVACRSAIKAGNKSSNQELIEIVKKLEDNPDLKYCPHGRPICVVMSKYEIEKQFGRV